MNAALMIQRKRKPSRFVSLADGCNFSEADWIESIATLQPSPEMAYTESETNQLINRALEQLKPDLRRALTTTYYDELSCREACASLGVSPGALKARIFRARRQLSNQLHRSGNFTSFRRVDGPTSNDAIGVARPRDASC